MKKYKLLILALFLSFLLIPYSYAEELGSIKGLYTYDNKPLSTNNIHLYKIAEFKDIEADEKFTYLENYNSLELDINNLNRNEWQNYANLLKTYIETNSITYDYEVVTDSEGNYEFKELNQGLYLMLISDMETDLAYYKSLPTLISIPNYDEVSKSYINDITINSKIEENLKVVNQNQHQSNHPKFLKQAIILLPM